MSNVMSYLFETNAIRFCEENKPFWYTSGKIGPYFINTHFVYGSEKDATDLLSYIDECLKDKNSLPKNVFQRVLKQYSENSIYQNVINTMVDFIKNNINVDEIDFVSGGERRDWFFSNIVAFLLNKPHISIYKDLSCLINNYDFSESIENHDLTGKNVLHIADLITVASSYIRAWIPAIRNLNADMKWSLSVVNRMQGGKEKIESENVKSFSLVNVDETLFQKAFDDKIINQKQLELLNKFFKAPDNTMRDFLINHPDFIKDALNSDEKTAKRARLLLDDDIYNLKN